MSEVILAVRGLLYRHPGGAAGLQVADLRIRQGAKLAILGANGAGKSTLLLHLNGTLRPERGEILLGGHPVAYSRRGLLAWRRQVGLVLQDPDHQLFAASVSQDVSFGPLNLGLPEPQVRERVAEALRAMELEELRDRPTQMLSYGQRKRVAIAGLIAMRPRILILDEPTAGLDPQGAEDLLATLERLHQTGTTLIMATHDMDLAYAWADQVAVVHQGSILRQGPPEAVLQDEKLLMRSHLRTPWALTISLRLREVGLLPPADNLPRTRAELLDSLHRIAKISEGA